MLKKPMLVLLFFLTGCSQSLYMQGREHTDEGRYEKAIDSFYKEIKANPKNHEAWRELGVAFYQKGDLIKAEEALKQANNIRPDARTNLYIGLIYEKRERYDKAISAYAASLNMKPRRKTKSLIKTHLDRLIVWKIRQEARQAIDNEKNIDVDTIPINTIAIVDFDGSQLPYEMAPISKGLAEFTAADLAKVRDLNVVERLKIDAILKELQLGSSKFADPDFAPRAGRLLGSRRIITGSVLSTGDDKIRLDGAIVNTADSTLEMTGPSEGALQKFFEIQKEFVFKIIDSLGITLTIEERDAIQEVPTESFLAFMAYCRGLHFQSLGMYDAARQSFERARNEDKDFQLAEAKLNEIVSIGSSEIEGEASFQDFELSIATESERELLRDRLSWIQTTTMANFGLVRDRFQYIPASDIPTIPPLSDAATGAVIIKGDLDAE
jgi:tetratricopeptide (TPR) repeat protein